MALTPEQQIENHKWARKSISNQPKFNGETGFRRWFNEWTAYHLGQGVDADTVGHEFMKKAMCAAMQGIAVDMIQPYATGSAPFRNAATFQDYYIVVRGVFEPAAEVNLARESFKLCKQLAKEDVSTFITRKNVLWEAAFPDAAQRSFVTLFEETVNGVYSKEVKREMLRDASRITNLTQMREKAIESAAYCRRLYQQGLTDTIGNLDGLLPTTNLAQSGFDKDQGMAMEIDALKEQVNAMNTGGGKNSIKCYLCNKNGHYAKDCWSKKKGSNPGNQGRGNQKSSKVQFSGKCGYCKKVGHKEAECFQKKRDKGGKSVASQGKGSQRTPPQRIRNVNDEESDFLGEEGPLVDEE